MIHFTRSTSTPTIQERQSIIIQAPSPFPYKSEKVIPWKYGACVLGEEEQVGGQPINGELVVKNISGIGEMTRSSRIFTPPNLVKDGVGNNESVNNKKAKELLKGKTIQTDEGLRKDSGKEVSDEEACEFLKFIQQSEYKVVEQLNRMPARISLLGLLMLSTSHRKLLMKILSGAHVEQNISLDSFEGIVSNITTNNYLTFTDEEILTKRRGHNKALHVSIKCLDHVIAHVLIDNGSSLNVMPKATLGKLPCEGIHMKPSTMIVRAFDGSKREVMEEVELRIQIGPCVFQITFQVMDILLAYSCLLGRPWIHSTGVVPSTLHRKLKYVMGDKLVIVSREEDILVSGYKPTREDKRRLTEERRERSMTQIQGKELGSGKIHICDIKDSFHSAGWINTSQIAAVKDEDEPESSIFVQPCAPNALLNNWETLDLPVMFNLVKM